MTCPFKEHRIVRGAASAQWIRLRLPSFCPRFESQAYHPRIYQFIFELCSVEKMKINKKRPGLARLNKRKGEGEKLGERKMRERERSFNFPF